MAAVTLCNCVWWWGGCLWVVWLRVVL